MGTLNKLRSSQSTSNELRSFQIQSSVDRRWFRNELRSFPNQPLVVPERTSVIPEPAICGSGTNLGRSRTGNLTYRVIPQHA
eukprot:4151936-Amphidinium_carterae.1